MSGPRDRYDSDAHRNADPHERWRVRIQDEIASDIIYRACLAYNRGERSGFAMYVLDEIAHAHSSRSLDGERMRIDRKEWQVVARTVVTYMRAEWIARREAARKRDEAARAATTRRIIIPPNVQPPRRGALYAGR